MHPVTGAEGVDRVRGSKAETPGAPEQAGRVRAGVLKSPALPEQDRAEGEDHRSLEAEKRQTEQRSWDLGPGTGPQISKAAIVSRQPLWCS